jgi:mRNA-degrading endonuclease toxin of MazEF toxin-antitoxin module
MPTDCVASFDYLKVVPKAYLVDRICAQQPARLAETCAAAQATID